MSKTIEQRANHHGFPKAGELIEIMPQQELSLQDRRIFNLLIENAGPQIAEDRWHEVALQELRGWHKGNERVCDSIDRLMSVKVKIPVQDPNGLPAILTTVLITDNLQTIDENDSRAILRYKFSETTREIIGNSRYWARLKAHVMFAFSSKYSLALYEAVCLRINLKIDHQEMSVAEFRRLLDVPDGKLPGFPQFRQCVLEPAALEVNGLSDFWVEIEPLRHGHGRRGKLKGFRLSWARKSKDEWLTTLNELSQPKIGRKARLAGTVEDIAA